MASDSVEDLPAAPNFKRRRTAPPLLDGVSRGWAQQEEEDEDYAASDSEDDAATCPLDGSTGEYSSTNSLLRELHTLNQHRLLFSSPTDKSRILPLPIHHHQHSSVHGSSNPILPRSKGMEDGAIQAHLSPPDYSRPVGDEMEHVMKRYEESNR